MQIALDHWGDASIALRGNYPEQEDEARLAANRIELLQLRHELDRLLDELRATNLSRRGLN